MLLVLDAGAEDLVSDGDMWRVTTAASELNAVRDALVEAEITPESADLTMLPTSTVAVTEPAAARTVLKLMDMIDDLDDVQDVYSNFDIGDDIMEELAD